MLFNIIRLQVNFTKFFLINLLTQNYFIPAILFSNRYFLTFFLITILIPNFLKQAFIPFCFF